MMRPNTYRPKVTYYLVNDEQMRKWLRVFTYIYHKNQPNAGKYTSPMDPMEVMETFHIYIIYDRPIKELFMGSMDSI